MDVSQLNLQFQALQNLARPGSFSAAAFLTEAARYQAGMEAIGAPTGCLSSSLELMSRPGVQLDHTAVQAYVESAKRAGLVFEPNEGLLGFQQRRDMLRELLQPPLTPMGRSEPVSRLFVGKKRMEDLLREASKALDPVPTYKLLRPRSGVSLDGAPELWEANDTLEKRTVALRVYHTYQSQSDIPLSGVFNAVRFQSNAPEDRVVRALHVGNSKLGPYLVMEWMEGGSAAFVRSSLALARQMVEAVALTHQAGILHRDIRPANFFVTKDQNKVKLGEFAIAIREEEFGLYSALSGNAVYMPPEFSGGTEARDGYERDVYSLGFTLFQFLTGLTAPQIEVARQQRPGSFTASRGLQPAAEAVIRKAMDARPERRYANAILMMEEIEETWPA